VISPSQNSWGTRVLVLMEALVSPKPRGRHWFVFSWAWNFPGTEQESHGLSALIPYLVRTTRGLCFLCSGSNSQQGWHPIICTAPVGPRQRVSAALPGRWAGSGPPCTDEEAGSEICLSELTGVKGGSQWEPLKAVGLGWLSRRDPSSPSPYPPQGSLR
jgi:hypothetical protein